MDCNSAKNNEVHDILQKKTKSAVHSKYVVNYFY